MLLGLQTRVKAAPPSDPRVLTPLLELLELLLCILPRQAYRTGYARLEPMPGGGAWTRQVQVYVAVQRHSCTSDIALRESRGRRDG